MCLSGFQACYLLGRLHHSFLWIFILLVGKAFKIYRKKVRQQQLSFLREAAFQEREVVLRTLNNLPAWVSFPDTERVEWLNKIIKQLWPYIGEYAIFYLQEHIIPSIRSQLPAAFKSMRFTKIAIGDVPLRIVGVKVFSNNVGLDRVIMDMDLTYSGDAEVTVRLAGFRGGMKQLQFSGKLRVVMKPLLPYPPMIGALSMYFVETPVVDFDLTGIGEFAELPGLIDAVRSIVSSQLEWMCVLPNEIVVPLVQDIDLAKLYFPEPDGIIRIKVIEARNLENMDYGFLGQGVSDPYCEIQVGSQQFRTRTVNNSLNPIWNECFEAVVDEADIQNLRFDLFDEDVGSKDDELGRLAVRIADIRKAGIINEWYPLESCKHGDLHFKACWYDLSKDPDDVDKFENDLDWLRADKTMHSAILLVYIDEASGLLCPKSNIYPSPYIVITVGRVRHCTPVKTFTTNPIFQYKCLFFLRNPRTDDLNLEIFDEGTKRSMGVLRMSVENLLFEPNLEIYQRTLTFTQGTHHSPVVLTIRLRAFKVMTPGRTPVAQSSILTQQQSGMFSSADSNDTSVSESSVEEDLFLDASSTSFVSDAVDSDDLTHPRRSFAKRLFSSKISKWRNKRGTLYCGKLLLDLSYDTQMQNLNLIIYQAAELLPSSEDGSANSYITAQLMPLNKAYPEQKQKTPVVPGTLDPVFNYRFRFGVMRRDLPKYKLQVKVKDAGTSKVFVKNPLLGIMEIRLENFDTSTGLSNVWIDLEHVPR